MKTRGLIDLYLPSKVAYHIKIILESLFIAMFFNLIWKGTPFVETFWLMLILVVAQLEIFMAIAMKMFHDRPIRSGKGYKSEIIVRLLMFYSIVFLIASAFVFLTIALSVFLGGVNFSDALNYFVSTGLKAFLISWIVGISMGSIIFFYMEWNSALKREQKLREEKLIFQYETLKNQVNPHFLFNSLNTLASLVSKDPELSEQFISKFSSIYRYILENRDKDLIKLSEEIAFIHNYFFLQKIRDNGKVNLQIEIKDPNNYQVLPISLQLLVENALKHNAATKESPLKIRIYLEDSNTLVVENNLQKRMHIEPSSKIGLRNLKERILLVMNKEFTVEESREKFVVKLPIMKTADAGTDHRG